jgi:hypothetical protein
MKTIRTELVILATLASCLMASAQQGNAWAWGHNKDRGGDGGLPAAPEPAEVLMLAGGLTLVGGYIAWRRRQNRVKPPA